ncbi:hypothetical protein [Mycolicibacter sinensis]|uniref:hypothetical protein n=1 Tax=Mycolicibacter sinensis (strain JDM601) TaxID=875328 RepID=UPI0007E9AFB8|nr:hypothetical protein [Mycolicibacter sinensis]OBH20793.1 hypothetical protein A5694_15560 [Mycolicibacter sinensis]
MTTTNENLSVGSATLPTMTNTHITSTDHIRIPAGAVSVTAWDGDARDFTVSERLVEVEQSRAFFSVEAAGTQSASGAVVRHVWVTFNQTDILGAPLTVSQARQIGEALIAAAEELEQLGVEAVGP